MQELRRIARDILARGRVDADHLVSLRLKLYSGGTVGQAAADFLVELHKQVGHPTPPSRTFITVRFAITCW